jgi:hypothetical protein
VPEFSVPKAARRRPEQAAGTGPVSSNGAAKPARPRRSRGIRALIGAGLALVVVLGAVVPGIAYARGFTKADGGHVIVVRNGGPFDDNSVRQVIQPNSSLTSTGLFSSDHPYPSTQR